MSLEIRIAASADAPAACQVLRRSITECCIADHNNDPAILDAWLGNKNTQTVASWFESPTNFSLVAVENGAVVGVALLTAAGKLALCYLLPEARHKGAGKALLARIEAQAASWGVKALQLHSTASGEEFFARQGYIRSGNVRSPYGVDTVFFWKQLGAESCPPEAGRKRFCGCGSA
ncbi:GNAT family N-acetyltransferase [Massilia sp. YIM B04103]|uniref:GNAT family N-acetyltransferase n=1 Tax=Massilia sp. YIM B04103 TaxID=2963106 RepID=UPI00210C104C|nr:GNAT family N-acetyltransferase [Massilia sp. YIM B04103]